jgi:hypothetical protein
MIKSASSLALFAALSLLVAAPAQAQARLTIVNQSQREMIVKVMKVADVEDTLHGQIAIPPLSSRTISFSDSGLYYAKTMATLAGRNPIYQKGQSFRVYVGRDGYSVLTLTFTIVESAVPQLTGGRPISSDEFDKNVVRHP